MYGYDAGVLGGVQTTQPYLDAMGVSVPLLEKNPQTVVLMFTSRILKAHMLFL